MEELWKVIDNEFSVYVINILNLKLEEISSLVSENMDVRVYEGIADALTDLLVDASKEFFIQGFLRGIAVMKCGVA
ncbi:MAG: hypothetical protein HFI06_10965 [Eubacterium sp.]|jgi:hypothetical protein|nr:hypothetical protein [Eubacterium sp.]